MQFFLHLKHPSLSPQFLYTIFSESIFIQEHNLSLFLYFLNLMRLNKVVFPALAASFLVHSPYACFFSIENHFFQTYKNISATVKCCL